MNNKDLIEDIKAKLKASKDIPYREGAWERFAAQQTTTKSNVIPIKRIASIAAVGILVLGLSIHLYNQKQNSYVFNSDAQLSNIQPSSKELNSNEISKKSNNDISPINDLNTNSDSDVQHIITNQNGENISRKLASLEILNPISNEGLRINNSLDNKEIHLTNVSIQQFSYKPEIDRAIINKTVTPSIETMAHRTANELSLKTNENITNKSRKMSIGDKVLLGLYVSPHRTSHKFDVGAGVLVSYALNKKLSLRTGASYNSYSVAAMKDPFEANSAEKVNMEYSFSNSPLVTDKSTISYAQEMILPNINAVMGKVESLEIPIDLSYNLNNGFYTSVGASYSVILKQQREAEFVDFENTMYSQDITSIQPNSTQNHKKVKTKTVSSAEDNVNPNGFNGFANFSIGKKVNFNKDISLSLEPFVKVPLGQFRKSDLNYTNSGIRIITTF